MITPGQALWIINNIPQNPSSTSIMPSVWQNSRRQVLEELQAIVDAEQSVRPTSEHSTAAFSNSDLNSDEREDSNPLFFTRG